MFYNDYDTYFSVDDELALISYINEGEKAKICGGIGMQSHVDIKRPTLEEYGNALKAFINAGLEVQITELDITINFDTDDTELMNGIKTDTLITSADIPAIEELLTILCRENVAGSTNRKQYENMLMQMILMKISESSINPDSDKSRISALEMLRTDIYSNARSYSNIYQLAEKMNLSPSYLQAIYKRKFGISCYEDILSAKIKTGQYYLSTTDMTVKEISDLCGYGNEICFMKIFKKRTGITPSEYRKISKNDNLKNNFIW